MTVVDPGDICPTEVIHIKCCKKCPSALGKTHDPEVRNILKWPKKERLKTVFTCAWRQNKLCRGYYDLMIGAFNE